MVNNCRYVRISFTIHNPTNPKPVNVRIGVDKDQFDNKELVRNGFGIILTTNDGIVPTQRIHKSGAILYLECTYFVPKVNLNIQWDTNSQ